MGSELETITKKIRLFVSLLEAKNTAAYSVSWTNKKRQGGGG